MYDSKCFYTNTKWAAHKLRGIYDDALANAGLTSSQYFLLLNIQRLGQTNATDLAELVELERTTLVRNVKLLEANGWVTTTAGRGKQFTLTELGNERVNAGKIEWAKAQKEMRAELGDEDAEALYRITKKIMDIWK